MEGKMFFQLMLVSSLLAVNSFPGWPFCKGFVCSYNLSSYHTCDLFSLEYDNPVDCPQGTKCSCYIDLNCTVPENEIWQASHPLPKLPSSFYFMYTEEVKQLPTMNTTAFYYVHEARDHHLKKYYSSKTERSTNDVKFEIVREHLGKLEMFKVGSHSVGGNCNKTILESFGDYWHNFSYYNMISEVDGLQTWKYKAGKYSLDTAEREITTVLRIDANGSATPVESIKKIRLI